MNSLFSCLVLLAVLPTVHSIWCYDGPVFKPNGLPDETTPPTECTGTIYCKYTEGTDQDGYTGRYSCGDEDCNVPQLNSNVKCCSKDYCTPFGNFDGGEVGPYDPYNSGAVYLTRFCTIISLAFFGVLL